MEIRQLVQSLLTGLVKTHTTDCYILPQGSQYRILSRRDEKITHIGDYTGEKGQQLIAYLKYQANMAVSEHRRPQSGAIHWGYDEQLINLRLSTVGDFHGLESLVIRFIYPLETQFYRMLNFEQWRLLSQLIQGQGLILFAGPMGSGKTTTMYRLVKENCGNQVILTIEDPVEIEEKQFIQLQVNPLAQMGYQDLLHLGLRHRPQVLIVGEIRDPTTAQTAVEAALSGHLVLATIHARSARGVVPRLKQLGVSDYYLEQSLLGACYQRMIPLKKGGSAVLFDLQNAQNLKEVGNNEVGSAWQGELQKAYCNQKITKTIMEEYWKG